MTEAPIASVHPLRGAAAIGTGCAMSERGGTTCCLMPEDDALARESHPWNRLAEDLCWSSAGFSGSTVHAHVWSRGGYAGSLVGLVWNLDIGVYLELGACDSGFLAWGWAGLG